MASLVLTDAHIEIDANDLSDHANEVTLEYSADEVEDTNFGDGTHLFMGSTLKNWSLSVTFAQDYADGELDSVLWPLVGGSAVTVKVRPTSSAVGTDNPEYSGSAVLLEYTPVGGSVGDRAETQASFSPAGTLSRATA